MFFPSDINRLAPTSSFFMYSRLVNLCKLAGNCIRSAKQASSFKGHIILYSDRVRLTLLTIKQGPVNYNKSMLIKNVSSGQLTLIAGTFLSRGLDFWLSIRYMILYYYIAVYLPLCMESSYRERNS